VVWDVVSVIFCASPQYSFARIFYNLSRREHAIPRFEEKREGEEEEEEGVGFSILLPDTKTFLEWENSGREFLLMFVFGLFYWFVFVALEWRTAKRIENAFEKDTREDECDTNDGALTVMKLKKQYRKDQAPSVDSISFKVSAKEAFALCGVNGAGKTTSFAMLSGLLSKTNGYVRWASATTSFGYCAQTNGVEDFLTPLEHLDLFASVVTSATTSSSSSSPSLWCERFQSLQKHKTVLAKNLSGGAKRELCVAIALSVAEAAKQTVSPSHHPSLVLLDEPTAGVDPYAKTKLWKAVENVMNSNQGAAVVITSHDVFECEKVCASVGLLRDGKFLLCGNTSDIKKEFSNDAFASSSLEDVFIAVVEREEALEAFSQSNDDN
jgi:ABC-type multidrug transport system ATPase subunit